MGEKEISILRFCAVAGGVSLVWLLIQFIRVKLGIKHPKTNEDWWKIQGIVAKVGIWSIVLDFLIIIALFLSVIIFGPP